MTVLVGAQRRGSLERALPALLAVAAGEFAVLVGSGLFLVFFYRPGATQGVSNLTSESSGDHMVDLVRLLHRSLAGAMTLTLVVVAVVGVVMALRGRAPQSRWSPAAALRGQAAAGVGLGVLGLLAVFTGFLLPWNQLFLFADKVASDIRGFRLFIWHPSVIEHATVRGSLVPVTTIRIWLLVHLVVVPSVVVALGVLAARRLLGHRVESDGR